MLLGPIATVIHAVLFWIFFSSVLFCITVSAKSLSASAHPLLNLVAFVAFSIEFRLFKHFQVWVLRGLLVPNRPQNSRGEWTEAFFFVAFVHSLHPVGVCWFGTNWFWTPLGVLIKPIQAFQVCAGLFFVTCPCWNSCVYCRMECTPCAQLSGQNIKNGCWCQWCASTL